MKKEFYDVVAMKPGGMKKIRQMLSDGWLLQVCIGGRNISLENK